MSKNSTSIPLTFVKKLIFIQKKSSKKPDFTDIFRITNYSLIETFVPCV